MADICILAAPEAGDAVDALRALVTRHGLTAQAEAAEDNLVLAVRESLIVLVAWSDGLTASEALGAAGRTRRRLRS